MNAHDKETMERLRISTVMTPAHWTAGFDILSVSINGYGDTRNDAIVSLLLRTIECAPQYMRQLRACLGHPLDKLDVNLMYEFFQDGSTATTIQDAAGRTKRVEGLRVKKEEQDNG